MPGAHFIWPFIFSVLTRLDLRVATLVLNLQDKDEEKEDMKRGFGGWYRQ
jgi:hypothetical protein